MYHYFLSAEQKQGDTFYSEKQYKEALECYQFGLEKLLATDVNQIITTKLEDIKDIEDKNQLGLLYEIFSVKLDILITQTRLLEKQKDTLELKKLVRKMDEFQQQYETCQVAFQEVDKLVEMDDLDLGSRHSNLSILTSCLGILSEYISDKLSFTFDETEDQKCIEEALTWLEKAIDYYPEKGDPELDLSRLYYLEALYKLTKDDKYLDRLEQNLISFSRLTKKADKEELITYYQTVIDNKPDHGLDINEIEKMKALLEQIKSTSHASDTHDHGLDPVLELPESDLSPIKITSPNHESITMKHKIESLEEAFSKR